MLKKLQNIAARYEELGGLLASPEVLADMDLWKKYSKERAELAEIAEKYGEYRDKEAQMNAAFAEAEHETGEMKEFLLEEARLLKQALSDITAQLKILLLPKDKNDDRNCTLELRAGAGGEEAALFVYSLYRICMGYCEKHRLQWEARTSCLNTRAVCTACSACPKRNRRVGFTRPRRRSPSFPKRRTSRWKSPKRTSASICSAPRARVGRRSTRRKRRSASRTFRRVSS